MAFHKRDKAKLWRLKACGLKCFFTQSTNHSKPLTSPLTNILQCSYDMTCHMFKSVTKKETKIVKISCSFPSICGTRRHHSMTPLFAFKCGSISKFKVYEGALQSPQLFSFKQTVTRSEKSQTTVSLQINFQCQRSNQIKSNEYNRQSMYVSLSRLW